MNTIKAILFDFGGTLDSDGLDWYTRLYDVIINGSAPMPKTAFDEYAHYAFDHICDMEGTTELLLDGTIQRVCQVIHDRMSQQKTASWSAQAAAARFARDARETIARNRPALEQLAGHYRLGCISNNWGNTAGWCRHYQLDDLFETMIDSTRAGAMKPDARIFQAALDAMNLSPGQCLYVGDRFDCDVLGSRAVGMAPVWIRHPRSSGYASVPDPDRHECKPLTITSVRELPARLPER